MQKRRDHFCFADARDEHAKLWSFDPASGQERVIGPAPEMSVRELPKSGCVASGALEACKENEQGDLRLSHGGKQIGHFHLQPSDCSDAQCVTPIEWLDWSPNGRWLLVEGVDNVHEGYYFLVDLLALKIREVPTAFDMSWMPGGEELLYVTPEDMASLPGSNVRHRNVWVQHPMLLNAATGTSRAITSGVSHNLDAALCNK